MTAVVQLSMPVPPPADFDPERLEGVAWIESTESLLIMASQHRRRMWCRREAVTVLLWRLHHAPKRRMIAGRHHGRPTKAHAASIEAVAWHVAGLAHLDGLDQEDPRVEYGPPPPPQEPMPPSAYRRRMERRRRDRVLVGA